MKWSLHPALMAQVWLILSRASVDLLASRDNTKCPLWFGVAVGTGSVAGRGRPSAQPMASRTALRSPAGSPLSPTPGRSGRREAQDLHSGTRGSQDQLESSPSQSGYAAPWPVPLRQDALSQAGGQIMRPHPQRLPTLGMADARMRWEADGFSPGVVETMMQNWAPSTMANYDPKWAHFKRWCCDMQRDPFTCPLPRCSDTSNTRSRKVLCPLQ